MSKHENVKFAIYVVVQIVIPALMIVGVIVAIADWIGNHYGAWAEMFVFPLLGTVLTLIVCWIEAVRCHSHRRIP